MTVTIDTQSLSPADQPNKWSVTVGLGCVGLFLLPFAVVGAITSVSGIQRMVQGNWREGLLQAVVGSVFAGFAGAAAAAMVLGRRKLKEQEALQALHPDRPWLWQREWASGRISDSSRSTFWTAWIFAGFWNLVSFPVGFVGVREALQKGNHAGYVAVLFPLAGIGLLVWAARATLRYRRYGVSRLELSTIPGTIGHSIAGTVRVSSQLQPEAGFNAALTCVRRVTTRSGKNSSTSESVLWQEEKWVRGELSRDPGGMSTRIPIAFRIPSDAQSSDASNSRDQVVWRLQVSATVPGIDYQSTFEVPVFRTPESARPATTEEARIGEVEALALADYRQPPESKIAVTHNRRGTEIFFPAARNPGAAAGSTVFTLLWIAIVAALIHYGAPRLFPVVFALFAVLLVVGTLQLWLGVSRVTVDAGSVTVAQGYLYPGRERRIAAGEITDVSTRIGMQAGSRPYYDVVIVRRDGKPVIGGRSIRDKREAEWVAFSIKTALGARS